MAKPEIRKKALQSYLDTLSVTVQLEQLHAVSGLIDGKD